MKPTRRTTLKALMLGAAVATLGLPTMAQSQSAEEFFAGKTLRVMNSTSAGGTMDLFLLLMMKHMEKHLPSGTSLVLEHRDGAGGLVGANHLFNVAPSDGTYFGMLTPYIVFDKFAQPASARYEPGEFGVMGRMVDLPRVYVARGDAGVETMDDLVGKTLTHAVLGAGTYNDLLTVATNEALGADLEPIPGYGGGGPMFIAMEQGEVQSTTAEPGNLIVNKWHLVESGDVKILSQAGLVPSVGLEDVPLLLDFVPQDSAVRERVEFLSSAASLGLSLFTPPGVPEDRMAWLQDLLARTMSDPDLIAEAQERNIPLFYATADDVLAVLARSATASDEVKQWVETTASSRR